MCHDVSELSASATIITLSSSCNLICTMTDSVYFASTILHLYVAAVLAAERAEENAHLIFIDQPEDRDFPLYPLVQNWQQSPFKTVRLFHGRFKGLTNKLKQRKELFGKLENVVNDLRPNHLFVGNDRRIEFQWSMHVAQSLGLKPVGHYMDEGTYTYLGRKDSGGFGDAVLDNMVKKLSYGFWWKNPPTIGGSEWIQHVHAAFPEHVHRLLQHKELHALPASGFTSNAMLSLSKALMQHYGFEPGILKDLDALFTLPHESLFNKNPAYKQRVLNEIQRLSGEGKRVAAKYHPRNSGPDVLGLQKEGVVLLPAGVSFEAMLPHIPGSCTVIGDVSSTLLISKWLRNELQAKSLKHDASNDELEQFFNNIGITQIG